MSVRSSPTKTSSPRAATCPGTYPGAILTLRQSSSGGRTRAGSSDRQWAIRVLDDRILQLVDHVSRIRSNAFLELGHQLLDYGHGLLLGTAQDVAHGAGQGLSDRFHRVGVPASLLDPPLQALYILEDLASVFPREGRDVLQLVPDEVRALLDEDIDAPSGTEGLQNLDAPNLEELE